MRFKVKVTMFVDEADFADFGSFLQSLNIQHLPPNQVKEHFPVTIEVEAL